MEVLIVDDDALMQEILATVVGKVFPGWDAVAVGDLEAAFQREFPGLPVVVVSANEDRRRTEPGRGGLIAMAEKYTEYVPPDPTQIEDSPRALRYWAGTLETEEDRIRRAVRKVGPMLEAVKKELGIAGV